MTGLHPYGRITEVLDENMLLVMSLVNAIEFEAHNILLSKLRVGDTVKIIQIGSVYAVCAASAPLPGVMSFRPYLVPDNLLLPNMWGFMGAYVAASAGHTVALYGIGVISQKYGGVFNVQLKTGKTTCRIYPGLGLKASDFEVDDKVCVHLETSTVCGLFDGGVEDAPIIGNLAFANLAIPLTNSYGHGLDSRNIEGTIQRGNWSENHKVFIPDGPALPLEEIYYEPPPEAVDHPLPHWAKLLPMAIVDDMYVPAVFRLRYTASGVHYERFADLTMPKLKDASPGSFPVAYGRQGVLVDTATSEERGFSFAGGEDRFIFVTPPPDGCSITMAAYTFRDHELVFGNMLGDWPPTIGFEYNDNYARVSVAIGDNDISIQARAQIHVMRPHPLEFLYDIFYHATSRLQIDDDGNRLPTIISVTSGHLPGGAKTKTIGLGKDALLLEIFLGQQPATIVTSQEPEP